MQYGIKQCESLEAQLKRRLIAAVSELAKHGLVRMQPRLPCRPGELWAKPLTGYL